MRRLLLSLTATALAGALLLGTAGPIGAVTTVPGCYKRTFSRTVAVLFRDGTTQPGAVVTHTVSWCVRSDGTRYKTAAWRSAASRNSYRISNFQSGAFGAFQTSSNSWVMPPYDLDLTATAATPKPAFFGGKPAGRSGGSSSRVHNPTSWQTCKHVLNVNGTMSTSATTCPTTLLN